MTTLTPGKTVVRQTTVSYRGRPLIAEMSGTCITYRQKGKRHRVSIDHEVALEAAYKMLYNEQKRQKAQEKKERKERKKKR